MKHGPSMPSTTRVNPLVPEGKIKEDIQEIRNGGMAWHTFSPSFVFYHSNKYIPQINYLITNKIPHCFCDEK